MIPSHSEVATTLARELQENLLFCQEALDLVTREHRTLRESDAFDSRTFHERRKTLLPRLDKFLDTLPKHRAAWLRLSSEERARHPEVGALLRANQDSIMRIIVLDRENEQALLRHGLVPPQHLPPAQRQRPHFVADLYRRQGGS